MSDINVTAHGINPETGEYLSPSERKALFKKGKMGSKINTEAFKSGVVTGVKAAQSARQKAESDVGDFAQQERDLDALNDAAAGGGKGAIVPFKEVFSNENPSTENVRVNVDDAPPQEAEESKESFKDALKKLLETLKRITNLKSKQNKSSKKTDGLKGKKKKEKKKERKTPGRDIFGVGRKIKGKVANVFGDIFGLFGDIIAFAALSWISNPKNTKAVKGIIKFMGHAFKFINAFATFFIDNTLTGLSQLLGPDSSIGDRIGGALKLIGSFFMLKWMRNPFRIIKDVKKLLGIFKKFGKFVNKIFGKPVKMIQNFVQKSLNKTLGKAFMSKLFKPLRRFIIQVGGKSLFKLLGAVGRGFTKMISRIPFVGALLEFFLDVFVFKKPPTKSAFKAIGSALVGSIAAAVGGPFGAFVGGWVGGGIGEKIYEGWFGSGPSTDKEDDKDTDDTQSSGDGPANPQISGGPVGPAAPPVTGTKAEKWIQFREYGRIAGAKYPDLVAAQFALESGWGSALAAQHNYFGIKATEGESATTSNTREVINGQSVYMDEPFKNFSSPQDAVNHLVRQWYKDYRGYKGVNNASDVYAAASMLKSEGYATDPKYAPHLQKLIRSNSSLGSTNRGEGGGNGIMPNRKISPSKPTPVATLLKNSPSSSMMPSMSTEFVINEKIKINESTEPTIIINNGENNVMNVSTTGITTLNNDKPTNPVLSRL